MEGRGHGIRNCTDDSATVVRRGDHVIVHSSWFPVEERRLVEERLLAFGSWLTLEYMDPDSRVYSVHRSSKEES
jgi:hypothetical protein